MRDSGLRSDQILMKKYSRKISNNKERTPMSPFILTKMYTQEQ